MSTLRIIIAGSGHLGANLLRPLCASQHEVVAVVQNGRERRGSRRLLAKGWARLGGGLNNMLTLAAAHRLPVFWLDRMTPEALAPLAALKPDLLLVGGFGIILRKPLLELPRLGCINTHTSLLPRHRGANPFSAVIRAGDSETGVTFHAMDTGIDSGAILAQERFRLSPTDTSYTVYMRGCALAGAMVVPLMDQVAAEGIAGTAQHEADASYDKKPTAEDALLDFRRPAEELDRIIRAYTPSPLPYFRYNGRTIYVNSATWNAAPAVAPPGMVIARRPACQVATADGTITLTGAFTLKPVPAPWPMPWGGPQPGELLLSDAASLPERA